MKTIEIVIHIVSGILAIAGLFVGTTTDFFGVYFQNPTSSTLASFTLGLLIFLIGERFAFSQRFDDNQQEIFKRIDEWRRSIPEINTITRFKSCDDALLDVAKHLDNAANIYNTQISRDGIPSGDESTKIYKDALLSAIESGARMVDIVSPQFKAKAEELTSSSLRKAGDYKFHECKVSAPCFLNFIIIEYNSGVSDLWIGWATSRSIGMEQPAYRIRDNNLINYFRTYHQALRD